MKKIAFLVRDLSKMGGAERVACNIANALAEYYDVTMISMLHEFGEVPYELNKKIHCNFLQEDKTYSLKELVIYSRKKLRKILKEEKIEILLCIGIYSGIVGGIHAFDLKTKVFFCDHNSVKNQLHDKKTTLSKRISSRLCDYTIVLTKQSLKDYTEIFKTPEKKLIQIYNWIDDKVFEFAKPYQEMSNKIISVGRLAPEKGFDRLVEVAKELKQLNLDWQWDVYGDGPEFDAIYKKIQEHGLENQVFLKGQENFIYDKYADYAMFVLTSYREGLPLVLLEAKANHLPIVSFDIQTGPAEIVADGENGFLVEDDATQKMAEKINELLKNKNLRVKFSQNAYQKIEEFEKEKILKQWINIIRRYALVLLCQYIM